MKSESKIINNQVELIKREDQIYIYRALPKSSINLETMKQMTVAGDTWNGTTLCANLIDIREVVFIDSKVRTYAAEQFRPHVAGQALLISSKISSYFANIFLQFNKPKVPTKLFTNEDEALVWLKVKMQMHK
jgi:hypothetical protein